MKLITVAYLLLIFSCCYSCSCSCFMPEYSDPLAEYLEAKPKARETIKPKVTAEVEDCNMSSCFLQEPEVFVCDYSSQSDGQWVKGY